MDAQSAADGIGPEGPANPAEDQGGNVNDQRQDRHPFHPADEGAKRAVAEAGSETHSLSFSRGWACSVKTELSLQVTH